MLLYIHVPFCKSKCRYCAFYSEVLRDDTKLSVWKKSLLKEIEYWQKRLNHPYIESIFFGGGTPSLLPPSFIEEILNTAAKAFHLDSQVEISMEVNPESITKEKADAYLHCGINRISLGVQAWDNSLLRKLGRIHSAEKAEEAFYILRNVGFKNIGVDLMWGLPTENPAQWEKQLEKTVMLRPEHLSCYGLTIEEGTVLAKQKKLSLPSEDEEAQMYFLTKQVVEQNGYHQYEISNYALQDRECRHNLGYWNGRDYLGLGPAAVSTIEDKRWEQPHSMEEWNKKIEENIFDNNVDILTQQEIFEEFVMLRLRMNEGLSLKEFEERTGCDFQAINRGFLDDLFRENLAECSEGYFHLTTAGMLKSNAIISRFFETLPNTLS